LKKDYNKAIEYDSLAYNYAFYLDDTLLVAEALESLADNHMSAKNYQSAIKAAELSSGLYLLLKDHESIIPTQTIVGLASFQIMDLEKAHDTFFQIVEYCLDNDCDVFLKSLGMSMWASTAILSRNHDFVIEYFPSILDDYENMFPESEIQFVNYYETKSIVEFVNDRNGSLKRYKLLSHDMPGH
jgi:tetratricopeptide (TPR) repeat protein